MVAFTVCLCVCTIFAGQWKAGIKVFDRLEVDLQPVRVSINQDLIDQIKLYTFPPPHDTRMAQQAFIFGGTADSASTSASAAATDLVARARIDQGNSESEAAAGTGRGSGTSHFGDRDLGFEDEFAEDEVSAATTRGPGGRSTPVEAAARLSLEPDEAEDDHLGVDQTPPTVRYAVYKDELSLLKSGLNVAPTKREVVVDRKWAPPPPGGGAGGGGRPADRGGRSLSAAYAPASCHAPESI